MQQTSEQRRRAIPHEVSRILSESHDLEEAAPRILRSIGEGLAWDYAGLWTVDRREGVLRCAKIWSAPDSGCPQFEAISRRVTFSMSVGLPGRVWASGEPSWIANISRDANFARLKIARSEGLHTALAFPILLGGHVLGVFEFLSREIHEPDRDTLDLMASLGSQIGQVLERERSREAVDESEARKSAILEAALDAIITMDREGRVVEWNPAAERTFGYSHDQAVGREMAELIIPPSFRWAHRHGLARYLDTGEGRIIGERLELSAMRSDGSEFPVELTVTRVPLGGPPLFTGYIRDITERKAAEKAISESEERLRAIFEGAAIGIRLSRLDGKSLDSNPAWQRMLGYSAEELRTMHFSDYTHPADVAADARLFAELVAGERDHYQLEKRYVRKSGEVMWGRLTVSLVRDGDGKPQLGAAMIEDITERKLAEEQLKRSEALLTEAQRIAHLGSWEWDILTDNVRWSEESYRIYGYAPGALAPTRDTFWRLVHPDDRQRVQGALQDALDGGTPYDIEHRVVRPDGIERVVHRQGEVVRDGAGNPVRMVGTVIDVTERAHALEQAERALELRNHFLSMASHELKTPVTLLKGYAQLLRNQADRTGDEMLRKPVRVIERQVGRIHHLVDELLDVSRVEGGRLELDRLVFELGPAVLEVVDEVRETTPGFELKVCEWTDDLLVVGDRARIQQVATNLLINAVKYSGRSKKVDIALGQEGNLATFSVSDRGIGIPAEQHGRVFELYFRGANAPGGNYGGLGLGLYISKAIVEQHGGRIDVESEEGTGSTFLVSLPLADSNRSDRERQG